MKVIVKLQQRKWYWTARKRLRRISFLINRSVFGVSRMRNDLAVRTSIAIDLLKTTVPSFLTALAVTILLMIAEQNLPKIHSSQFTIISFVPDLIQQANGAIKENLQFLPTILSLIASISAIFIGLYFTAISVLVSSVYAKVPHDIRNLLLKEKVGNAYIKILIILTSICVLLLGYISLGYTPGILNLILIAFVGCFGVISFGMLGIRTFYFFDPTSLADLVFAELLQLIKSATVNGFFWDDESFQVHYRRNASRNLITLETLVEICKSEKYLKAGPLATIIKKLIYFLAEYSKQRAFIPSQSKWYAPTPKYSDWFLTDHSSLHIAIRTQTSLQPIMMPNHYWMEEKAMEILDSGMSELIVFDLDGLYNTIDILKMLLENFGSNLELDLSKRSIDKVGLLIDRYFQDWEYQGSIKTNIELAVYDVWASMPITAFQSFCRYIRETDPKGKISEINKINFSNSKEIYVGMSPKLLDRVEYIHKCLEFERRAEGETKSPKWYTTQLVVARLLELIKDSLDQTSWFLDEHYIKKCDILLQQKQFLLNAVLALKGRQLVNAINYNIDNIKQFCEKMDATRVNREIPWTEFDWDSFGDKLERDHDKLIGCLAKSLPSLFSIERQESFPDIFGQAYSFVLEDCYASMLFNNPGKFKMLFSHVFISDFLKFDQLREQFGKLMLYKKDLNQEGAILASSEPLMDLMTLSGYAKIFSELHDSKEINDTCESIWNKALDITEDTKGHIEFLMNLYKYRKRVFKLIARDIYRTNWQLALNSKLRELSLIEDRLSGMEHGRATATKKHKSALIRALCRGGYEPHQDPIEVFIIMYLLERPDSKGIEFEDRWGLKKAIEEETKRMR